MAVITDTDAARIVLDLIKDRTVANATPYGNVDMLTGAIAIKYGQAFWDVYHEPTPTPPTNAQLAAFYFEHMKKHHKDALVRAQSRAAGRIAQQTAQTSATTEANTDLGNG